MRRAKILVLAALAAFVMARPALAQRKGKEKPAPEKPKSEETVAPVVASGPAAAELAKAEKLYAELEYEPAANLGHAVLDRGNLHHDELVRALRIVALAHAAHDQEEAAREAFVTLLGYEPDYQVDPNLGPRVTTPFFSARGYWRGQTQRPGMEVTADVKAETGGSIHATIRDPLHFAKKATISWRWAGKGDYETVPLTGTDGGAVELGPAPPAVSRLEYFATATDAKGNEIFEAGSVRTPKVLLLQRAPGAAAEKKGGSILTNPIFLVAAGAVVVAGGVTAGYFLFRDTTPTTAVVHPNVFCANGPTSAPCN